MSQIHVSQIMFQIHRCLLANNFNTIVPTLSTSNKQISKEQFFQEVCLGTVEQCQLFYGLPSCCALVQNICKKLADSIRNH